MSRHGRSLGLRQEVQKRCASQLGLGGPAVGVGEGRPQRLHRHLGSTLLTSVVQLQVPKYLTWEPLMGSGPGCVTRLVWKEKAFAA